MKLSTCKAVELKTGDIVRIDGEFWKVLRILKNGLSCIGGGVGPNYSIMGLDLVGVYGNHSIRIESIARDENVEVVLQWLQLIRRT